MKRQNFIRLFLLFLVVGLIVAVRYSPVAELITFENLKSHREALVAEVDLHYGLSVAAFIFFYAVVAALALPFAAVLTIFGGFLYGTAAGAFYANIGALSGGTCSFLFARYLLGNRLQEKYGLQLRKFNEEFEHNGANYLLTLRLIPVFPFFVINILAGLTKVPLRTFFWTTWLGIIPGSLVFAFAGRRLSLINAPSEILSPGMLAAFLGLASMALAPALIKRMRGRRGVRR